jgi:hypothetical protein
LDGTINTYVALHETAFGASTNFSVFAQLLPIHMMGIEQLEFFLQQDISLIH